jgi:hypothetical protein
MIQCVTRTRTECLGRSVGTAAVERELAREAATGTCADSNVPMLGLPFVAPNACYYMLRHFYYVIRCSPIGRSSQWKVSREGYAGSVL